MTDLNNRLAKIGLKKKKKKKTLGYLVFGGGYGLTSYRCKPGSFDELHTYCAQLLTQKT